MSQATSRPASRTTTEPTAASVAEQFPEAVALAREFREVFGEGVRLTYARNAAGEELGRRASQS
jgi:hypothetical protein